MSNILKLLSAGLLSMFLLPGCTSDMPNSIGTELSDGLEFGNPQRLLFKEILEFGNLEVTDSEIPNYSDNEILYFGHQGDEESSILLKYNMADLDSAGISSDFTADDIESVKIRLRFIEWYYDKNKAQVEPIPDSRDTVSTLSRTYKIHNLTNMLTEDYTPGSEPEFDSVPIWGTPDEGLAAGASVVLDDIDPQVIYDWYNNGHNGIVIKEGARPDTTNCFLGFVSKELSHFTHIIADEQLGTNEAEVFAPALVINFVDPDTETLILWPEIDTSTLDPLDSIPEGIVDNFVVRTHVRNYPWFSFDTTIGIDSAEPGVTKELPADVLINRASLFIHSDSTKSYGPLTSLVVAEVPGTFFVGLDSVPDLIELQDESGINLLDGQSNIDPYTVGWIELDVTSNLQRFINGVYDGMPMHFMLLTGENMFPSYDLTSTDPGFYLSRFWFNGSNDEEFAPRLSITYTERTVGGE
jgi:hypothetical protein